MAKREFDLLIEDEAELEPVIQALNTSVRRKIMCLLRSYSYSIAALARKLKLPVSTVSFHVNILKKAGLINVTVKRNTRGNAKLVSRSVDRLSLDFATETKASRHTKFTQEIPLGSFSDAQVEVGCGMADENGIIIADDMPGAFFSPLRLKAQMLWFSKGYIEYRIPNYMLRDRKINAVVFSMEICSEAPNYNNEWESDITFWVNGVEVATYLSPGDFGGRRGRLNPEWWSDYATQYGVIKTIRITEESVFLDETPVSTQNVETLDLKKGDYFTFRIGIKENAKHQGGVNLFGEKFGDFLQGLVYMVDFN